MDTLSKKQIGQILLEKNYLNQTQLELGLKEQQKGNHRTLGQILLELGYITQAQLDEVLTLQV
jgi:hypothetical protein